MNVTLPIATSNSVGDPQPSIGRGDVAASPTRILQRHTCGDCGGWNTLGCENCDGEGGWLVCTFCGENEDVECGCDPANYPLIEPVAPVATAVQSLNPRAWPPCKHCGGNANCEAYDPDTSAPLWGDAT